MKEIIDYKLFESMLDIKNDIEGILIELVDNKYAIEVKMDKYVVLKSSSTIQKTISFSNSNDRRYSSVSIVIKNNKRYNTNDIEDYILTVIDYLKSRWGDKNSYGYEVPDRLEKNFYTFDDNLICGWNTYSEFPKDLQLRQFLVCIRKY